MRVRKNTRDSPADTRLTSTWFSSEKHTAVGLQRIFGSKTSTTTPQFGDKTTQNSFVVVRCLGGKENRTVPGPLRLGTCLGGGRGGTTCFGLQPLAFGDVGATGGLSGMKTLIGSEVAMCTIPLIVTVSTRRSCFSGNKIGFCEYPD